MGTWCSDSKEQIPAFYKILDELNCDSNSITLINVDRNKKGLSNEIKKLNIELIPTIIFYKQRKKIGRIIETPYESLEKDLINITNN
jgi:thiol-disulfide isomerase/thioredoxin